MNKTFVFPPYENYPNYPSYALRQHILSGPEEVRLLAGKLAREISGPSKLERHFAPKMEAFFLITYQDAFCERLIKDWVDCVIAWIDWPGVLSVLRGKDLSQEPTDIDMASVTYLETIPGIWQTIVSGAKGGEDQALKDWILESTTEYITNMEARVHSTPTETFVRDCLNIVIKVVRWTRLAEALEDEY